MHFGNHPVLQLNLSGMPTNFDSAFCLIWHKMIDLFRKHDLRQSSELSDIEKKYYCDWCEYKEVKYSESNEAYLLNILYELSRLLQKHHGRNTIILVDEFDSLVTNAMFSVSCDDLLKIIKLRDTFLGNVMKNFSGKCTYDLAVLTGVADVVCTVTSPLRSLNRFRFSQEPILLPYYGIIDSEFEKITQDLSPELRTTLIEWYNGYSFHEANIYNPWSLTKAIVSKKTEHYWLEETNVIYKFQHLMNNNEFSILMKKLIIGEEIICDLSLKTVLSCEDLKNITRCFQNSGVLKVDIILVFLYQHGYLTSSRKNLLKIPNKEISEALERLIHNFVEHGNIRWQELDTAAADLRQCLEEDFKIDNFRRSFEIICEHYNPKFVFNHQVIHSLLFSIILRTPVQWEIVGLECPIEEFYIGSKRCDIVLLFLTLLLIIEVKYLSLIHI